MDLDKLYCAAVAEFGFSAHVNLIMSALDNGAQMVHVEGVEMSENEASFLSLRDLLCSCEDEGVRGWFTARGVKF